MGSTGILKPALLPCLNHCNNRRPVSHLASLKIHPTKGHQDTKAVLTSCCPLFRYLLNGSPIIFHVEEGLLTLAFKALQVVTASSPPAHLPLAPVCALPPWTIHCPLSLVFHPLPRACHGNSLLPPSSFSWKNLTHPLTHLKGPFFKEDFHNAFPHPVTEFLPNHVGFISIPALPSASCSNKSLMNGFGVLCFIYLPTKA